MFDIEFNFRCKFKDQKAAFTVAIAILLLMLLASGLVPLPLVVHVAQLLLAGH